MNDLSIYDRLNGIFRDVFDDESIDVHEHMTASDIDDWDSLANVTIIVAIEKEFGIKLSMPDVIGIKCVGDMVMLIKKMNS